MLNRRSFLANASGLAATLAFRDGLLRNWKKRLPASLTRSSTKRTKTPIGPNCASSFLFPRTKFI